MALAKSSAPAVRSLANDLLASQDPAAGELVRLLHQRAMAPPMLANEQRRTLNRLARLQGRRFDREFLLQVGLKSQQQEVERYQRAALTAADPVLRAWITRALPTVKDRLSEAERLAQDEPRAARSVRAHALGPRSTADARAIAARPNESNTR
jgi:predicted outer membrane protein